VRDSLQRKLEEAQHELEEEFEELMTRQVDEERTQVLEDAEDTLAYLDAQEKHLREVLSEKFPGYFILNNPIDLTGSSGDQDYGTAMKAALVDNDFFDAAIVISLMPPETMTEGVVDIISQMAEESGKPVVICTIGGEYTRKIKIMFEKNGLPVFPSPERCVKAMCVLVERGRMNGC